MHLKVHHFEKENVDKYPLKFLSTRQRCISDRSNDDLTNSKLDASTAT